MIYFLTGENWYGREQALKTLVNRTGEQPEYLDVEQLTKEGLRELLGAQTLFAQRRCVVLRQPSENKAAWEALEEIVADIPDDVVLIITEEKPDKRTKTYKALQKQATVKDFPNWTERDAGLATEWLLNEAKKRDVKLKTKEARLVVQRIGANQGRLAGALEKLSLMDDITVEAVEASIESYVIDSAFVLLETALRGETGRVQQLITSLRQSEDAYRVFGLLGSQLTQLAALVYSTDSPNEVARSIGASPFVLSKLAPFAARLTKNDMRQLLEWAADVDMQMKSIAVDPWILVSQLLLKIANR